MVKIKLKVGDKAPLFKLDSYNAGIFSRYFGCPICQLDLNILMESVPEINNKGAKLLYVTQSGEKVTQEFIAKYKIEFPVIASSKKELYAEYGLGLMNEEAVKKVKSKFKEATERGFVHGDYEGWENQGPGQFVIGEDGNILHERKGWLLLPEIFAVL